MNGRSGARKSWTDGWAAPLLASAAAVAAFVRAVHGGFVFDDHRFIAANPFVQRPESWLRFFTDATTVDPVSPGGIVRPLRTVEFALDRAAFGVDTFAFHVHSLAWHAAAAALLVLVLRRLFGDGRFALVAALAWAVHPAQAESAAWISSRGDVAMGACVLASVLFALRSAGNDRNLAVSLAAAAVAGLYKETAVALPLAVAAMRWLKFVRVPVWPYVAVAAAYLVYRRFVQSGPTSHGVTFVLGGSTAGTFATMIRAFGFYLAETLLPAQSLDWYMEPSTSFADGAVLVWLAVHAALVRSAFRARRTAPLWTLAVAWFYVFLGPVANWPVSLGIPTTERFLYLPLAGAAIAFGAALRRAAFGVRTAAAVAVIALGASSALRCGMWTGVDALWSAVLADHESPRALAHFAEAERAEGLALRDRASKLPEGPEREAASARLDAVLDRSLTGFHRALEIWYRFELSPRSQGQFARRAEINASNVAYLMGRDEEALFHADEALLAGGPAMPEPHYNRALALSKLGFAPQAMVSMWRAREDGFGGADAEIGGFFLRMAAECETGGMPAAADAGYTTAVESLPEGPQRSDASARLAALRQRPRTSDSVEREHARIAELDAALAALARGCPARRGRAGSK